MFLFTFFKGPGSHVTGLAAPFSFGGGVVRYIWVFLSTQGVSDPPRGLERRIPESNSPHTGVSETTDCRLSDTDSCAFSPPLPSHSLSSFISASNNPFPKKPFSHSVHLSLLGFNIVILSFCRISLSPLADLQYIYLWV